MTLEIEEIFSNDQFVVIDKKQAFNFHTEDKVAGLFEQVKASLQLSELYPVHRLDKLTTGLVIFAKTKDCAGQFGRMFEAKQVSKYYLAISDQKPKKKQGWIKGDMAKSRRGSYKLMRTVDNPAITQFMSCIVDDGNRLFLVKPHSGKTHQVRVALKSIGSPIIGDQLYYPDAGSKDTDRGYLHAYGLHFSLDDKHYEFVAAPSVGKLFNIPNCKEQLCTQWSKPWELFRK
jgi:tRNA pseudouridine32 synthase/23S rRNA pseudouridine746 synthase